MAMDGFRLFLCLIFSMAVISSARNTFIFSEKETVLAMGGRSLKANTNDYDYPGPNPRHNPPPPKDKAGGGSGGGGDR